MKIIYQTKVQLLILSLGILFFVGCKDNRDQDQANSTKSTSQVDASQILASWNDGATKQAIIDFVTKVTKEGTPDFIPVEDRIATFDNDGTLWAEQPIVQMLFIFHRVKELAAQDPKLKDKHPFKAVIENDTEAMKKFNEKDLVELVTLTQTNISVTDFQKAAAEFFAAAKYPGKDVPLLQIRYQPQLELLEYLTQNDFKIYICTGGTVDFLRVVSKQFYNIEPENVIGSSNKYEYRNDTTGVNDLFILSQIETLNDKKEKPVNIMRAIGKRPVLACGNEGGAGDVYMLRYSQGSKYPSLQLLVNHDDAEREYVYSENPDVSLAMAKQYNWNVISIKDDWKTVFATE